MPISGRHFVNKRTLLHHSPSITDYIITQGIKIRSKMKPFLLEITQTETAREFFLDHFLKKNGLIFLLPASRTCSMPSKTFWYLIFCLVTYNFTLILKTFRHFKTAEGKKLCNDDVNRASSLK